MLAAEKPVGFCVKHSRPQETPGRLWQLLWMTGRPEVFVSSQEGLLGKLDGFVSNATVLERLCLDNLGRI